MHIGASLSAAAGTENYVGIIVAGATNQFGEALTSPSFVYHFK